MSEEGNKNPRNMDKEGAKALPLRLDLEAVSSSGHGGEYHLRHRVDLCGPMRHTDAMAWSTRLSAMMGNSSTKEEADWVGKRSL